MIRSFEVFARVAGPVRLIALCEAVLISVLIAVDWRSETIAWTKLSAAGVPVWGIALGIAFAWLTNLVFWFWVFVVGIGAFSFWKTALPPPECRPVSHTSPRIASTQKPAAKTPKRWWYWFLGILPAYGAANGSQGIWIGLLAGLIFAAVLFVFGEGVMLIARRYK